MKIVIKIDDTDKEFTAPFISARKLKETIKMSSLVENIKDEGMIDTMAEYITDIYGKKFTTDQLLDGVSSTALISYFVTCVQEVAGNLDLKMEVLKDPNVVMEA